MSSTPVFSAFSSGRIANLIQRATTRVVYAAPGIHDEPAAALVGLTQGLFSPYLTVSLDFDERTLRMGYGSLEAIELLRKAEIGITHAPGFRSGILIVDDRGWIFTPIARYLEDDPHSDETPNAIELSQAQVESFAVRFCAATRFEAAHVAHVEKGPDAATEIAELPHELGINQVSDDHFEEVKEAIKFAPPVKFDVVRQVRVFEPYLQYVEMKLTGAAIQNHRVQIPADIQKLGASADLEGRLRTTFDLLSRSSSLSSGKLEEELNQIRKDLTPSLGKSHGRAVLKSAKPHFEACIRTIRAQLVKHQEKVKKDLQSSIDESRQQVVKYYLPLAKANPPNAVIGGSMIQPPPDEVFEKWLNRRLENAFPTADALVEKMELEVRFKDVTFETLNEQDFIESVKKAFPDQNWDKVYSEFRAAGEKRPSHAGPSERRK
jgi:hypothetical protein